ncbi:MAG: rhomboid family intramembrane serine protease, partial [Gammaproteobacteria bacterium]|nr:rhomboid family intramembrane serine protease [Gammaproteobacteria bacterium]
TYRWAVPPLKTKQLWYHPGSWDPVTMLTANFAHGGWDHVIGNLVFFFAFATAVELIVGSLSFAIVVLLMSFGTSISYSLAMASASDPLPTVGLSGVVMGMMALLTYLWPTGKIRCFWWFLIRFGTVAVPAWLLALWYIGFDVYHLLSEEEMGAVNLVAHVSGALIGLLLGMTWFRRRKRTVHEITN